MLFFLPFLFEIIYDLFLHAPAKEMRVQGHTNGTPLSAVRLQNTSLSFFGEVLTVVIAARGVLWLGVNLLKLRDAR